MSAATTPQSRLEDVNAAITARLAWSQALHRDDALHAAWRAWLAEIPMSWLQREAA